MIVVAGDSHTSAMVQAYQNNRSGIADDVRSAFGGAVARMVLPGYAFHNSFHSVSNDGVRLRRPASDRLAEMLGNDGTISSADGNIFGFSLGFHAPVMLRQDYWAEFTLLTSVAKQFLTNAVFREMVLHENRHIISFAKSLQSAGVNFFLISSPPIRQAMIERQAPVASAAELVAIKTLYQQCMETMFDDLGVRYITAPEGVSDGPILKAEFTSRGERDVHHANPKYGVLVWRKIIRTFANNPPGDLAPRQ